MRFKVDLPNYGVFDEKRVFAPGPMPGPVSFRGVRLGIPICEDIWGAEVVECLAETGGEILLVPNGSPYWRGKAEHAAQHRGRARDREPACRSSIVNQVGGQDELVFDGASFVLNADRSLAVQLPAFREAVAIDARGSAQAAAGAASTGRSRRLEESEKADYAACVLGLRDYVDKNGFPGVVLGLSGGIDSALCAAMAVDALGAERVRCVMLPYRFTSQESLDDAAAVAKALGVHYDIVPIEQRGRGLGAGAGAAVRRPPRDVTEENLQARARGTILMAISNKFGLMVVTTGNKSEMSVGYATLYGDMNGGFNPIKDLYKTEVYRLSRLRNRWKPEGALGPGGRVIPENIITRRRRRNCARTRPTRIRCRPTTCSTQILERLVEREEPIADDRRRGLRPRDGAARSSACSTSPNTSAGRRRRA